MQPTPDDPPDGRPVRNAGGRYGKKNRLGSVKDSQRTRVANGTVLLPGVDGRNLWVRRVKENIQDHVSDCGGIENMSAAERSLVRRASVLEVELERLEAKFAVEIERAEAADLELYSRATANLRRLFEVIGLERRPRTIAPDLDAYLQAHGEGVIDDDAIEDAETAGDAIDEMGTRDL